MTNYRRNFVAGGSFFFTVKLGIYPGDGAGDTSGHVGEQSPERIAR